MALQAEGPDPLVLITIQPNGPISFVAVSAGRYVTLELARQLLQAGRDVHERMKAQVGDNALGKRLALVCI